ncbi:hypothetical protein RSAG8_08133, partial [Rhizoctonia solani AG-8 WAC10335]
MTRVLLCCTFTCWSAKKKSNNASRRMSRYFQWTCGAISLSNRAHLGLVTPGYQLEGARHPPAKMRPFDPFAMRALPVSLAIYITIRSAAEHDLCSEPCSVTEGRIPLQRTRVYTLRHVRRGIAARQVRIT